MIVGKMGHLRQFPTFSCHGAYKRNFEKYHAGVHTGKDDPSTEENSNLGIVVIHWPDVETLIWEMGVWETGENKI